jgi:16S rRNA (guanine966-N2)-methyltransferase
VRESLFNIVTARRDLTGLAVLDLYAGSGALGLEALSRGAVSALFVESDQRTASVIARNISAVGLPGATLRRGPVATVLAAGTPAPVDLVLADPPCDIDAAEVESVLAALSTHGWVHDGSLAVVERAATSAPLTWPEGWTVWPERVYGDTRLELGEFR